MKKLNLENDKYQSGSNEGEPETKDEMRLQSSRSERALNISSQIKEEDEEEESPVKKEIKDNQNPNL